MPKDIKQKRADRRARTRRILDHRQKEHHRCWHTDGLIPDPNCYTCRRGIHSLDTLRPFSCGCRKRTHGAPRKDAGQCNCGMRGRIYRWRQDVLELQRLVARGEDPDSDVVVLCAYSRRE